MNKALSINRLTYRSSFREHKNASVVRFFINAQQNSQFNPSVQQFRTKGRPSEYEIILRKIINIEHQNIHKRHFFKLPILKTLCIAFFMLPKTTYWVYNFWKKNSNKQHKSDSLIHLHLQCISILVLHRCFQVKGCPFRDRRLRNRRKTNFFNYLTPKIKRKPSQNKEVVFFF